MDAISFVLGEKTSNLRVKKLSVRIIDGLASYVDANHFANSCRLSICSLLICQWSYNNTDVSYILTIIDN